MAKPTTITNGIRTWRYPLALIAIFSFLALFQEPIFPSSSIVVFLVSSILYYLVYRSRRIVFDDRAIYRKNGKKEKPTSFESIKSIKRSSTIVNGVRLWKVTYLDSEGSEKRFRYKEGTFQHGSTKEFIEKVKRVNPSLVVWMHPYFNRPEEE